MTDKTKSVPTEPIEWARKHDTLDEPLNPFQDESIAPVTEQVTHKTVRIKVWADIDEVIAPLVERLNEIPGVTTHASCQGQQAGPHPYGPYVMISWADNVAKERVQREFVLKEEGEGWGYVYGLTRQITIEELERLYSASKTCFDPKHNLFWANFTKAINNYFAEAYARAAAAESRKHNWKCVAPENGYYRWQCQNPGCSETAPYPSVLPDSSCAYSAALPVGESHAAAPASSLTEQEFCACNCVCVRTDGTCTHCAKRKP